MTPTGSDPGGGTGQVEQAELLARLRAGDEVLFAQLVTELTPVLTRLARNYTPSAAAAQDAVQDTWLTVIDKLDTFQGRSAFKTWVCGIVVHTARHSGVREARTRPFSSIGDGDHCPAVDPAVSTPAGTLARPAAGATRRSAGTRSPKTGSRARSCAG